VHSRYRDRSQAGRVLTEALSEALPPGERLILALPRGGVPVAYEVARALEAPLDVFVVRKLGVPGHEELAFGAIASGGTMVLNEDVVAHLRLRPEAMHAVRELERAELARREEAYRGGRPALDPQGKHAVLVDDGLATGASMRAAARALRLRHPASITVAVPVGPPDTVEEFRREVDLVVCPRTPEPYWGVGQWYEDFSQTNDDEVRALLARNRQEVSE
jgi:putative phosphoribosyl transferase